ncbi:putative solute carrier family 22 member 31 [Anolis carolinensis]|uniref:putative solute carrier family 22 member 31 n=1 Tax=Anolis carolinensis TaxID=28377 RepID=UPI002F2B4064
MPLEALVAWAWGGGGAGARVGLALSSWLPLAPLACAFFSARLLLLLPPTTSPDCRPHGTPNASQAEDTGDTGGGGFANASWTLPCALLRTTAVTQWGLVCSEQWKVPLEQATFLLGWILGYLGFGSVCDRFGRRTAFVTSLVLSVPLGFAVSLATSYAMFVLTHLLFGATLAGAFLSLYVGRLELCGPAHRLTVTMLSGFFWVAGELLLPGLAAACKDWRLLQAAVTLALALMALCWWCPSLFPESARWLLATHQTEEGKAALRSLAEGNGVQLEEEQLFAELDNLSEGEPKYSSVWQVFCTRVVWKNSLILGFTTFIGSGIRHSFTRNLPPFGPGFYFAYFLPAVSEALALLFLCLAVDRFGRRAALLAGTILTGLSSLLLLALTQYLESWLVLSFSVLGLLASQAVSALSVLFAGEVLPTVVRGAGLGLILAAGAVGALSTPLLDIRDSRGFFLHHVVFASFAILSVLSIMLLPETTSKPLPDSLRDGEEQRRPPLFRPRRRSGRQDHLPLLAARPGGQHHPYDPESYARLVTATKKMRLGGQAVSSEPVPKEDE